MCKRNMVTIYPEQNKNCFPSTTYRITEKPEEGVACVDLPKCGQPRILNHASESRLINAAEDKV